MLKDWLSPYAKIGAHIILPCGSDRPSQTFLYRETLKFHYRHFRFSLWSRRGVFFPLAARSRQGAPFADRTVRLLHSVATFLADISQITVGCLADEPFHGRRGFCRRVRALFDSPSRIKHLADRGHHLDAVFLAVHHGRRCGGFCCPQEKLEF